MNANHPTPAARSTDAPVPPAGSGPGPGLGPLVRADGHWFLGDHESAAYLALLPGGFEHRVAGQEPFLVPWNRLMSLELGVTSGRFLSTPADGLLTGRDGTGADGSWLNTMVRHPYDVWRPRFVHHRRWYPQPEITLLRQLLGDVVDLGRVDRLGDDAWLTRVVEQLAADRFLRRWRTSRAVAQGVQEIITRGA
ncbi:hypothetical protein ABZW03_34945 [Kitasatospora sp. NPDC004799]|uniref:hypothetical protein n=1 Tax=Kitasatospora sp. NPDC004799 TaxID=3154460 RepID=UPI0033A99B14